MENAYGIGINNRYALFIDDEDADPLDILAQASKEKLAVKAKKIEEATLTLNDMEGSKRKIAAENADLLRQLQEMENSANMLSKLKLTLADQLDEARAVADHEAKERQSLLGKFR